MSTALKRTVFTRSTSATGEPLREVADPALQRFLDAVWMERGLSANGMPCAKRSMGTDACPFFDLGRQK